MTTSDRLLWSVDGTGGEHLVLVVNAADATDPGIRVPMSRATAEWLIGQLADTVAAMPRQD